jgi:hypothetical protein
MAIGVGKEFKSLSTLTPSILPVRYECREIRISAETVKRDVGLSALAARIREN